MANHVHHRVDILMHRSVPETQGLDAVSSQNLITNGLGPGRFALSMPIAIQHDDQPSKEAKTVEHIAAEWRLPAGFPSRRPPSA